MISTKAHHYRAKHVKTNLPHSPLIAGQIMNQISLNVPIQRSTCPPPPLLPPPPPCLHLPGVPDARYVMHSNIIERGFTTIFFFFDLFIPTLELYILFNQKSSYKLMVLSTGLNGVSLSLSRRASSFTRLTCGTHPAYY